MERKESYQTDPTLQETFLACDVGGTNTSCALVGRRGTGFTILERYQYKSQQLSSLEEALEDVKAKLPALPPSLRPRAACVSGAGPVRAGRCHLTNLSWNIEQSSLESLLGMAVAVINDFTSISYGIPLLDTTDSERITRVFTPPAGSPEPTPAGHTVRAVVGAGTGLGVGYVVEHQEGYIALPSEGGHAPFAPYDDFSRDLLDFVSRHEPAPPGAECFVSGRGITNILNFFRETGRIPRESPLASPPPETDQAQLVSREAARGDACAGEIMRRFVTNYGHAAKAAALHFLPLGGLYLAGGIVTKNEAWFLEDHRFTEAFQGSYRENIQALLQSIPVFVVRDYEVSLYGAAYGAYLTTR
ncbi:glucokinase [Alkalispirochaeta americana]|uniref:Glucokinase n=1 Tax=Alkalispirochaeta americana TaxID=159291 RepID=A0A1N6QXR1_9SPIO|nr:glucokinase [Alkalispirochaeta americana]SIQ21375.1 glucokinase [Alkalispirochaeta americana]